MFFLAAIRSILLHQYFHRCYTVGMRIRAGLIAAIYKKVQYLILCLLSFSLSPPSLPPPQALRLSSKSRQTRTVGEIVTLMSVDAQRFMDLVNYLHIIWSGPLQIVLALIFLYLTMGPSIFAGLAIMILMMPVNAVVSAIMRRLHTKMMSKKDKRMKVINEILNGIKVRSYRKFYGVVKDVNFNVLKLVANIKLISE